jgi:hypothetical protein
MDETTQTLGRQPINLGSIRIQEGNRAARLLHPPRRRVAIGQDHVRPEGDTGPRVRRVRAAAEWGADRGAEWRHHSSPRSHHRDGGYHIMDLRGFLTLPL